MRVHLDVCDATGSIFTKEWQTDKDGEASPPVPIIGDVVSNLGIDRLVIKRKFTFSDQKWGTPDVSIQVVVK
jgi:hypothetical protein